ncbi:hypothetical protein L2E82_05672 [Cichorium intybus]|uniref:Uncharacterized protein n=1 Tax=Cichorium intybus TaxID=13427 RepID=A0ACB9H7Y6_CICIN|nr:hypothetical protein L2E82_05672 [Cichorium intybus]
MLYAQIVLYCIVKVEVFGGQQVEHADVPLPETLVLVLPMSRFYHLCRALLPSSQGIRVRTKLNPDA